MNPAPGKPGRVSEILQPAPDRTRQITTNVSTCVMNDGQIMATYKREQRGVDPFRTPVFARLRMSGMTWISNVLLQALAEDEAQALKDLCHTLLDLKVGAEEEVCQVRAAIEEWRNWQELPWELQPLGRRANKPRRKRLCRTDQHTGKRYKIYADTGARRASDPPVFKTPRGRRGSHPINTINPKDMTR